MQEVEVLRKHCDEVQQRSMKGNLIISSPNTQQRKSLLRPQAGLLQGDLAKEDATSLCCRLIELKTRIRVPKEDISACHILEGQGDNSSYIIRSHNLKPGSSWQALTAGLMTEKNREAKLMKLKGELEEANMAPEGTLAAPRQKHNGDFGIWVWIGKRASEGERREAMRNAQGFIKAKGLKPGTPITR